MTETDDLQPTYLDIMADENFPIGKALQLAGWTGRSIDIKLDKDERDLTDRRVQQAIEEELPLVDAVMVAFDCKTTSRIREKPNKGMKGGGPIPLRDEDYPWGKWERGSGRRKLRECCAQQQQDHLLGFQAP